MSIMMLKGIKSAHTRTRKAQVLIPDNYLEYMSVEQLVLVHDPLPLCNIILNLLVELRLSVAYVLHLISKTQNLIEFPLPAVLSSHLVLTPPPYVSDQTQLSLAQVVLGQPLVELVHGQIDDVIDGDRDAESPSTLLVPGKVLVRLALLAFVPGHRPLHRPRVFGR